MQSDFHSVSIMPPETTFEFFQYSSTRAVPLQANFLKPVWTLFAKIIAWSKCHNRI